MDELKITIGEAGQTVVTYSGPAEKRGAELARSIEALADVLTVPGGLEHLSACPQASRQDVFALLRSLIREQAELSSALEQRCRPEEREEAFRRAFRAGYSAGLQGTSSARGEIDLNEAVIKTSAGISSTFQHGAWTQTTAATEH